MKFTSPKVTIDLEEYNHLVESNKNPEMLNCFLKFITNFSESNTLKEVQELEKYMTEVGYSIVLEIYNREVIFGHGEKKINCNLILNK